MAITRCPHCEFLLLPEEAKARTCAGCGAVLNPDAVPTPSAPAATPEKAPAPPLRRSVLPWLAGIVVLGAGGAAAFWGWQHFRNHMPSTPPQKPAAASEETGGQGGNKPASTPSESTLDKADRGSEKEAVREMDLHGGAVTDQQLEQLRHLPLLRRLNLEATNVSGPGLEHLGKLNVLVLANTPTDDSGLRHLADLRELRVLDLSGTRVTDAGLSQLARLTKLQTLVLKGCAIRDGGLSHLAALKRLRTLDLTRTKVSDAGVERLQQLLPELQILR